jgi:hypothetical protein
MAVPVDYGNNLWQEEDKSAVFRSFLRKLKTAPMVESPGDDGMRAETHCGAGGTDLIIGRSWRCTPRSGVPWR